MSAFIIIVIMSLVYIVVVINFAAICDKLNCGMYSSAIIGFAFVLIYAIAVIITILQHLPNCYFSTFAVGMI